jgi:hypothetical protein
MIISGMPKGLEAALRSKGGFKTLPPKAIS